MEELVRPGISCGELASLAPPIPERFLAQRYECMVHGIGLEEENPSVCHPQDRQSNADTPSRRTWRSSWSSMRVRSARTRREAGRPDRGHVRRVPGALPVPVLRAASRLALQALAIRDRRPSEILRYQSRERPVRYATAATATSHRWFRASGRVARGGTLVPSPTPSARRRRAPLRFRCPSATTSIPTSSANDVSRATSARLVCVGVDAAHEAPVELQRDRGRARRRARARRTHSRRRRPRAGQPSARTSSRHVLASS